MKRRRRRALSREAYRGALRNALAGEAKAYGFTLLIWSTGGHLIAAHGPLTAAKVFAFLGGALLGIVITVVVAFGSLRGTLRDDGYGQHVLGSIHLISVVTAVLISWGVAAPLTGFAAYLVAALVAVLTYNLLLAAELALSSVAEAMIEADDQA